MRAVALLAALALAGCGDNTQPCGSNNCPWLDDYLREVVGKLSGEREIAPGVRLSSRSSPSERNITRNYLQEELARFGYEPELFDYGSGANVVARLPATTGERGLVVVGGHFDSVPDSPGAADNATGTAVVLAAARYFAEVEARDHPVEFVFFDQEELGLVGSRLYADQLAADEVLLGGMHNFDLISWDEDGDGLVQLWSPSPPLELKYLAAAELLEIEVESIEFLGSDHAVFRERDFMAIGVSEHFVDTTPHIHLPSDTYDKVNFYYLGTVARLGLIAIDEQLAP